MNKLLAIFFSILISLPTIASASGEAGTRCFQSPEGYGENMIVDRKESIDQAMDGYRGASSSANHFASCLAVFSAGVSLSMVRDQCGCWSAAKDVCSPPSDIRDWRDMSSDCKSFFPWGSY